MVSKVRTYIPGLDEILYGGIPERNVVLISGGPGTGKSILAKQFLYNGLERGENGIFVTLEEHPVSIRRSFRHFKWEISKYEKEGKFAIIDAFTGGIGASAQKEKYVVRDVDNVNELSEILRQAVKEIGAKRIAIDSVSTLYLSKPAVARSVIMLLKRVIAGLGCTALLVSQVSVGERGFGGPGVEHAVDGIIRLDLDEVDGKLYRSIIVWKMRDTKHSMVRHPMKITDDGIVVEWDKYIRILPNSAKIEELPKEEIENMKRSLVAEKKEEESVKKIEIEEEEES